jgi:hypothetical protein
MKAQVKEQFIISGEMPQRLQVASEYRRTYGHEPVGKMRIPEK